MIRSAVGIDYADDKRVKSARVLPKWDLKFSVSECYEGSIAQIFPEVHFETPERGRSVYLSGCGRSDPVSHSER